jgi:hypothetical protein
VSAEEVEKVAESLGNACISAEQSALEEAKKLIPVAQEMRERLKMEAIKRREALKHLEKQKEAARFVQRFARGVNSGARGLVALQSVRGRV